MKLIHKWDALRTTIEGLEEDEREQAYLLLIFMLEQSQEQVGPIVYWTPALRNEHSSGLKTAAKKRKEKSQQEAYGIELLALFLEAQSLPGLEVREIELDGANLFRELRSWASKRGLEGMAKNGDSYAQALASDAIARKVIEMTQSIVDAKSAREIAETVVGRSLSDDEWQKRGPQWERAWKYMP